LPDLFANRGLSYVKTGQYARAIADLDKALTNNPRDASSLYNRGIAKQQAGDRQGGEADVARARSMDPNIGN
jgi:Flp pilus assembly protein TadD